MSDTYEPSTISVEAAPDALVTTMAECLASVAKARGIDERVSVSAQDGEVLMVTVGENIYYRSLGGYYQLVPVEVGERR